jgi:hypothetical protein
MTQVIDNGVEQVTIPATPVDNRSAMLASASAIAVMVQDTENALATTAKEWGASLFRAVYVDGANMDTLIGDSKLAAGWQGLTATPSGKQAKARLEVYFSNARKVAEAWGGTPDNVKADILAGLSSIHYLAGQLRKAEKESAKEKAKEEKLAKAQAALTDPAAPPAPESEADTQTVDAPDFILALTVAMDTMTREDFLAIQADMAALIDAFDKRLAAELAPVAEKLAA